MGTDLVWRKSTFSAGNGGCVEAAWRTSSYSAANGDCVEVGRCVCDGVAVRDSKNTAGPVLDLTAAGWHALLHTVA
ncbi:uncharacterized protein DUF397 [Herbihabitans rhizosphaerae]|uniref:Uncharacterized protein DUF397 n=1 Tax=Herbihabitans rhizosphaerae TaxID=1872711 RepID=A0A4Q7KEE9_9PSEU|nr:DUF397 domain-containing protein [Herbihabitans rhizosphaerae]RZS32451.1 uncharacterized protein DUF397 [Herbihabitans rhizosphaerae]